MKTYFLSTDHIYKQDEETGNIIDIFGKEMHGIDDILEELNMLIGELRKTEKRIQK